MADLFYRWSAPSYNGGVLPTESGTTYGYINVGADGAGGANAAPAKVGGTAAGTFLVGFQEEALSIIINRATKVLSKSTDHLDNLMHRDFVAMASVAGTGDDFVELPIGTYLGPGGGSPTSIEDIKHILWVCDHYGYPIQISGAVVQGISLDLSPADTTLMSTTGGFSTSVVGVNLSAIIPSAFTVYYGAKTELATVGAEAFLAVNPLSHRASRGLDDIHKRRAEGTQSVNPEASYWSVDFGASDTAGAGAYYLRNGRAMTAYSNCGGTTSLNQDPLNSLWTASFLDTSAGGTVGFSAVTSRHFNRDLLGGATADEKPQKAGRAGFANYVGYSSGGSISTDRLVHILPDAAASVYTASSVGTVELTDGVSRFGKVSGTLQSSIAIGHDMIEVKWLSSPGVYRTDSFIITEVVSASVIRVTCMNGEAVAGWSTTPIAATVRRLLVPTFATYDHRDMGTMFSSMPYAATGEDTKGRRFPLAVYGPSVNVAGAEALVFGGHNPGTHQYENLGALYSSGQINAEGYGYAFHYESIDGTDPTTVTLLLSHAYNIVDMTSYTGSETTLSITFAIGTGGLFMGKYYILIKRTNTSSVQALTFLGEGNHIVSGSDVLLSPCTEYSGGATTLLDLYEGYFTGANMMWTVKRSVTG